MAIVPQRTSKPQSSSRRVASRPQGINKTPSTNNRRRSSRLLEKVAQQQFNQQLRASRKPPSISKATKRNHDQIEDKAVNSLPIKRVKRSLNPAVGQEGENIAAQEDPVDHWRIYGTWPRELFTPHPMARIIATKKSLLSLKHSADGSTKLSGATTDNKNREQKSAPYRDPRYAEDLQDLGFYMTEHALKPDPDSVTECKRLLLKETPIATELLTISRFADSVFDRVCGALNDRNEARVVLELRELIVPSAELLALQGSITTDGLIEAVDEGWNQTLPLTQTRPQPDYSVGYRRSAFTNAQLAKVSTVLGDGRTEVSQFRATWYMYFPFLTCEVKCGAAALSVADRQNAHSAGIAVRAIVVLHQIAGREKEINRKILAFSISHDNDVVRIFGYYPVIIEGQISYHRHCISIFSVQNNDGEKRWTAYKFVKNVYDEWAKTHLQNIRSVLDGLPDDITNLLKSLEGQASFPNAQRLHLPNPIASSPDAPNQDIQHTGLSQRVAGSHISTDEGHQIEQIESLAQESAEPSVSQTPGTSVSTSGSKKQKTIAKRNAPSSRRG